MRKLSIVLLLIVMAVSFSFAAGQSSASSGKIELNFLEVMTSPNRTEVLRGLIADYEKLNPNVTVNLISPPYEQADNRLTLSLQAQEPLDVIEVRNLMTTTMVNNKWLTDLTPYFAKWDEYKTLLPVVIDAASQVDGTPYLLPQWFLIKAFFIRTDIMTRMGITPAQYPKTLEELYAMAKRITNPAQNQFGFTMRGRNPFKGTDLLMEAHVPNLDLNHFYKTTSGIPVFDTPEYLLGLKNYVDLYKNAVPADAINWGFNEQINAFSSGITPFMVQDPDAVALVDEHLTRDQYTVLPMPVGRNGTIYEEYGYAGYSIPSYSKNKEAAWHFIAWLSSYTQNSRFCKGYGTLPIHSMSYTQDDHFSSGVYQAWQTIMKESNKYIHVKYPYFDPRFGGWAQVYEQNLQATLLGKNTPEQTAKIFADYWR